MKKNVRRLLSVAFILALVLSLALPAFAEGSIVGNENENVAQEIPQDTSTALEIFVSASGDDGNDGSETAPVASLWSAALRANNAQEATVYIILLSDITVTRTARFVGKTVILMSNGEKPFVVSRGGDFEQATDALRGTYNPAMIELGDVEGAGAFAARLTVENVVFDDMAASEGTGFAFQSMDAESEADNAALVQDAIIGVYGGSILTLNPGTWLRNFGGMSAIRAMGGSKVVVEDGSAVKDNTPLELSSELAPIASTEADTVLIGTEAVVLPHFQRAEEPTEGNENGNGNNENENVENQNNNENVENQNSNENVENQNNNEDPENQNSNEDLKNNENGNSDAPLLAKGKIESEDGVLDLSEGGISDLLNGGISGGGTINTDDSESGLTWTVDKAELYYEDGAESYNLAYTLNVVLSDTTAKLVKAAANYVTAAGGSFTITLDPRMSLATIEGGELNYTFTSAIFQITDVQQDQPYMVKLSFALTEDWKDHLDALVTPFSFTCTGVLPQINFTEDAFLTSVAKVNSLSFSGNVEGRDFNYDWSASTTEKEAKTKMLPQPSVTLVYDPNGGEGGPGSKLVSVQTGYVLDQENTPTHSDVNGYPVAFLGWTNTKDTKIYARGETAPATLTTINIEADTLTRTVYAAYGYDENEDGIADVLQKLYELVFDPNGGSGAPDPMLVVIKGSMEDVDIPEQEPTLKYYTFQGWSEDPDVQYTEGTDYYKYNASKKSMQEYDLRADTTLYAVWKQNPTYTLYYNANGGSNAPAAQSGIADENDSVELTITSGVPTRNGYSFLGWGVSRNGNPAYYAGNNVKISGGNVTLYAIWQKTGGGGGYSGGGSGSSTANTNTSPQTGDEAPVALYAALAVISLGAVGAGAWLIMRNQKKKQ